MGDWLGVEAGLQLEASIRNSCRVAAIGGECSK